MISLLQEMGTIMLRKEIFALKEEGYQGNDLKVKVDEVFNQVLLRQMKREKGNIKKEKG